jgi:hypothetical protein
MIQDLIELKEPSWSGHDNTVELVGVARERIIIPAAA